VDSFLSDTNGFALIAHDFEAFVEVTIDAFYKHRIVIVAREYVAVNVEEVESLTAHAKELAVLIKNGSETHPKMEEYFHNS
jgi:hypothetical protein